MRRIKVATEPKRFDDDVRKPGIAWCIRNPASTKYPPHWTKCADDLAQSFHDRCNYLNFLLSTPGQVDHFLPKSVHRDEVYEWDNYRYVDDRMNNWKRENEIVDPAKIEDDWFILDLATLKVEVTQNVPQDQQALCVKTITVLKLSEDPIILRARRRLRDSFFLGQVTLQHVRQEYPMLADALADKSNSRLVKILKEETIAHYQRNKSS